MLKNNKIVEFIKEHIKQNYKEYVIVLIFFISGIFLGVFFVNQTNTNQITEVHQYLENFINEIKEYENIENEINKKGIDIVTKEREEKYRKQFKERFEHSKKYDETWDVVKLIKKIIQTEEKDYLKSNNVEKIMLIDNTYNYILRIGYQKVSYIYSDEYLEINQ